MKITDIDRLAYNLYCEAVKNNKNVHDYLVGHLDEFVERHKMDNINSLFYYDKAKIKLRIEKTKINQTK